MPVSLEEYRIGQAYMRSRMQMENTRGSEGVEVVASQPFSDERMGAGHMAHVIYHFHSKAPAWLRALAPHGALCLEEQNWNAYPRSKTGASKHDFLSPSPPFLRLSLLPSFLMPFPCHIACVPPCHTAHCPYLTKFSITIESIHLADRGDSENALGLSGEQVRQRKVERALGLSEEQVKQRKVERVDIASHERDMWTRLIAKSGVDPSKLALPKAKRGPLAPGWQEACEPVMTAYKMVTVDAPYWGFGKRLELFVLAGERALFLEGHRKMYGWMDEWCELTMDDVRRIEKDNIEAMRKCCSRMDEWCELTMDDARCIEKDNIEAMRKVQCCSRMDEWCELTMYDVRRIEKDNIEAMRKVGAEGSVLCSASPMCKNLALNNKVAPDEYNEDESKDEVEDSQDYTDCSGADLADTPKGKDKAAEGQS
ncbi:unnamed protein product [Closterium sp. NIES-64]|nr:unnamed protein product [Closterium sp. NIES-64]